MKIRCFFPLGFLLLASLILGSGCAQKPEPLPRETRIQKDTRMRWWREARFGLFIHWGLYAIPAGEWNGETGYGEWIRHSAKIPLKTYDQFAGKFNPVRFDADAWVKAAKDAGMKYIVITTKHHDGFCLFDSKYTDFDVMSTPYGKDILARISDACGRQGLRMCWYHSIMDWHHPDYLPRRDWETDRPAAGASFRKYIRYMKNQLEELLTHYGNIGVLWFDGEWETTWNPEYGNEIDTFVRNLQPSIIINNRVGAGRTGMEGANQEGEYAGDFFTPEQQIPASGFPGSDWETCMTTNDHWGYNKSNQNWKSSGDLIRMLADIASKGGNYLLNVGPTAEGEFPQPALDRLADIGRWMRINEESIYSTQAGPLEPPEWGRCTQKAVEGGTRLFLHVFQWPKDGKLVVRGLFNTPRQAFLLADSKRHPLETRRLAEDLVIGVPRLAADSINTVVVLDVVGKPDVSQPPLITADFTLFTDSIEVSISSTRERIEIRYTLDNTEPMADSPRAAEGPIRLTESALVRARCFRDGQPAGPIAETFFSKVSPRAPDVLRHARPGIRYRYFEGDWDRLPVFSSIVPVREGSLRQIVFPEGRQAEHFAVEYSGFIKVPKNGVYRLFTDSDDGSSLYIGDTLVVDNDGLHGTQERQGVIALQAGFHPIRILFFEKTGGDALTVRVNGPGISKQPIPPGWLFIER